MIQHVWSVVCQSASFDAQTNRVSLFNLLENLLIIGNPTPEKPYFISCEIVSLWTRVKQEIPCSGQMKANLILPDGNSLTPASLEIDLTKTPFHRTRISIGALPLTIIGRYEFLIEYRISDNETWDTAARLPFIVASQNQ